MEILEIKKEERLIVQERGGERGRESETVRKRERERERERECMRERTIEGTNKH
jgi:hypothetical protein